MNSINLPEVRIKDAWLLRENASRYLHELWEKDGRKLPNDKWMGQKVLGYQRAWQPFEQTILTGMCETLGLTFRQNTIDVYIAPWFHAFSDPLVIGVNQKPDVFVDILTHELLHRLLTDNNSIPFQTNLLKPEWDKLFGSSHSFGTLVHIPVHAVHKAIYLDVLKAPERLRRDVEGVEDEIDWDASDYVKAWEYVEKHGYKVIIEQLRESYERLEKGTKPK
ncbi:MAG: hypothetical protein ACR2FM_00515 [Candidatus Saccharimonadales bacterium]